MKKQTDEQYLRSTWYYIKKVCLLKNSKQYEGCYTEWNNFETFFKDNINRFRYALKKYAKYTNVVQRRKKPKHPIRLIICKRKIKELGFTKKNITWTNSSQACKYRLNTHKYLFENKLLGTRDILSILKKEE